MVKAGIGLHVGSSFDIADELEALQDLHLWCITKVEPTAVELLYASRYEVLVPCIRCRPVVAKVSVRRVKGASMKARDQFPQLTQLALEGAQHVAKTTDPNADLRKVGPREIFQLWECN